MKGLELSLKRLSDDIYQIENVFQDAGYDWPGDWEGRALLAFTCLYEATGKEIPCMHQMVERLKEKTNSHLYFGMPFDGKTVDEQQLSGHSWYLRGLTKYAQNFDSEIAQKALYNTVNGLYLPIIEWYNKYPLSREKTGGVSGEVVQTLNGWKLSSDVGCAFMCVDGLAHYYAYTKDDNCRKFLEKIIDVFCKIDFVKHGFQTHTTLSCLRGILKTYETTKDIKYLNIVKEKFDLYLRFGMTLTYENYNWFGREDSWTEPCAVVDSFILATDLYLITRDSKYLTLARRIWFNGLQFCHRPNGGAGPNSCVTSSQPILKVSMYEAPFCCTMRYTEALLVQSKHKDMFYWNENAPEIIDDLGRCFIDDKMVVLLNDNPVPIFAGYDLSEEELKKVMLKVFVKS